MTKNPPITTPMFTALSSVKVVADCLERELSGNCLQIVFGRQLARDMLNHLRAAQEAMQVNEPEDIEVLQWAAAVAEKRADALRKTGAGVRYTEKAKRLRELAARK